MTVTIFHQQIVIVEAAAASPSTPAPSLLWLALVLALAGLGLIGSTLVVQLGLITQVQGWYLALAPACISLGIVVGFILSEVQS